LRQSGIEWHSQWHIVGSLAVWQQGPE
jgi:hypothetical protein